MCTCRTKRNPCGANAPQGFRLSKKNYPFWLALYQDKMTYPWQVDMWQYSDKGRVPGISGNVDLNVYMPN